VSISENCVEFIEQNYRNYKNICQQFNRGSPLIKLK